MPTLMIQPVSIQLSAYQWIYLLGWMESHRRPHDSPGLVAILEGIATQAAI